MRPIATDGVAWSLCLLITFVSPAKTAKSIEMPFGLVIRLGPRNHVLDRESRSSVGRGKCLGVVRPHNKHCESLMPFTLQ